MEITWVLGTTLLWVLCPLCWLYNKLRGYAQDKGDVGCQKAHSQTCWKTQGGFTWWWKIITAMSWLAGSEHRAQEHPCIPPPSLSEGIGRAQYCLLLPRQIWQSWWLSSLVSYCQDKCQCWKQKALFPFLRPEGGDSSQSLGQEQSWVMLGWMVVKVERPLLPDKGLAWERLHFLRNWRYLHVQEILFTNTKPFTENVILSFPFRSVEMFVFIWGILKNKCALSFKMRSFVSKQQEA